MHDDKFAIQTILFLELYRTFMVIRQWIDFFIDPVIDHHCLWHFLACKAFFNSLHQITLNCDNKITAFVTELIKLHYCTCDKLAFTVADRKNLFRAKVLDIVNVLSVFYPFSLYTKQAA